jgi:hypothetical protein
VVEFDERTSGAGSVRGPGLDQHGGGSPPYDRGDSSRVLRKPSSKTWQLFPVLG